MYRYFQSVVQHAERTFGLGGVACVLGIQRVDHAVGSHAYQRSDERA